MKLKNWNRADKERAAGALFVVNHSGGKDSQAMLERLRHVVPLGQLLVVHATLGDIEWPGALELAREQAAALGVHFLVAEAVQTFEGMVERRFRQRPDVPAFPLAGQRQCTSDLKRGPMMRETRRYAKAHGFSRIVTAMGMRAQESPKRAKMVPWSRSKRGSVAGREWFEWLPLHGFSTAEVFGTIREAGLTPHWAYAAGNERLSCLFCFLGSAGDARNGARHRPDVFERFVKLERKTGYTMHQSRVPLEEFAGITVSQAYEQRRSLPVLQNGVPS